MISINPKKAGIIAFFVIVIPAILAFNYFTRYNFVPVQLTIGTCEMDYTALPTYEERLSPLQSVDFQIKGWDMLVCYGQPSLRGREMIGERIAYDTPWRFGANEPTRFYTTADVEIEGIVVPKGRYSLYAVPGRFEWEIFINTSITHWGNDLSPNVQSKNIGSFKLTPEYLQEPVELFTIYTAQPELESDDLEIFVEWEHSKLTFIVKNLEEKDKTDRSLRGLIKQYSDEAEELESDSGN